MKTRFILLSLIVIVILGAIIPMFERFTITNEKTGNIVFQDSIKNYKEFFISFTHSVNRTPVNEYYRVDGNKFILAKATFSSYGAGMPEVGEYGSGKPSIVGGLVQIEGIEKEFESFTYFAGTFANHSLNTDSRTIYFTQLVMPQTPVTFEVKKVSLISMLRSYLLH